MFLGQCFAMPQSCENKSKRNIEFPIERQQIIEVHLFRVFMNNFLNYALYLPEFKYSKFFYDDFCS